MYSSCDERVHLPVALVGNDRLRYSTIAANLRLSRWSKYPRTLLIIKMLCPLGSVVEHSLHTRGVTSSNLVAGTNIINNFRATLLI